MLGSQTTLPAGYTAPAGRAALPGLPAVRTMKRLVLGAAALAGVVAVLIVSGFIWFALRIATEEVPVNTRADGIVVLTGGASRIADAFELLAAGRGQRLLISGVNRSTTTGELAKQVPDYDRLFSCCVDVGRAAINTVGNALETRRWARDRGFRSLIVVTSSYHMPRTMAELEHRLPDLKLIPFPVVTDKLRRTPWWSDKATAKLLFSEYLKYIVAQVRIRFEPRASATDLAGGLDESRS
jgi:uncharacterized SAM-binding protein YcdF (DUF218 family)